MTGIRKAAYLSRQISEPKALLNSEQILNILANNLTLIRQRHPKQNGSWRTVSRRHSKTVEDER